jgi:hypothetical protein
MVFSPLPAPRRAVSATGPHRIIRARVAVYDLCADCCELAEARSSIRNVNERPTPKRYVVPFLNTTRSRSQPSAVETAYPIRTWRRDTTLSRDANRDICIGCPDDCRTEQMRCEGRWHCCCLCVSRDVFVRNGLFEGCNLCVHLVKLILQ